MPIKKSLDLKRNLPTKGLLAHQMCCLRCDHKFTIQFESFHCISLPLVPRTLKRLNEPVTLKDCLNKFVSCEVLKDVVCENCQKLDRENAAQTADGVESHSDPSPTAKAKMKSTFVKRLTFAKLPQLLVIHLQRLVCLPNGMPIKKEDRVRFPSILVMDEYEHYAIHQRSNLNILNEFDRSSRSAAASARSNEAPNVEDPESFVNQQLNEATVLNGSKSPASTPTDAVNDNDHQDHANLSHNNVAISSEIASFNSTPIKQTNEPISASSSNSSINAKSNDVTDSVNGRPIVEECNDKLNSTKCDSEEFGLTGATTREPVQQTALTPLSSTADPANSVSGSSANQSENSGEAGNSEHQNSRSNNGTAGDSHKPAISAASETKATDEYAESELSSNKTPSNSIKFNSDLICSKQAAATTPRKDAKYRYKLNASVVHLGSCFSGHYIAHKRRPPADANLNNEQSGDWYFTSDSVVRLSSLEDALRSNGYMLFYERIK